MNNNQPLILVLGATGKVGGRVAELLAESGDVKVVVGVRSPEKAQSLKEQGIEGHLCFEVEDIDAAFSELEKKGVPTFVPPQTYALSNYWRRVGFVLDNNGNVIEFAEKLLKDKPNR